MIKLKCNICGKNFTRPNLGRVLNLSASLHKNYDTCKECYPKENK